MAGGRAGFWPLRSLSGDAGQARLGRCRPRHNRDPEPRQPRQRGNCAAILATSRSMRRSPVDSSRGEGRCPAGRDDRAKARSFRLRDCGRKEVLPPLVNPAGCRSRRKLVMPGRCKKCGVETRERMWGSPRRLRIVCPSCERARQAKYRRASSAGKRRWDAQNREKRKAHKAVEVALTKGAMLRQPCARCGNPRAQAHHDDYSRPLDVMWLCSLHHGERHRELRYAASAA